MRRFETELLEWFRTRHADMLEGIESARRARIADAEGVLEAALKAFADHFAAVATTRTEASAGALMAGGQERVLRRRIKTVQSTKKITKAMELIAASRIVKAQQRVAAARPYSEQITEVIGNLAAAGAGTTSRCCSPRDEVRTVAFVVITADRGLAGAYNSNVIRAAERAMRAARAAGREYALVVVGKKAEGYFRFRGYAIDAAFPGITDQPTYEDAREVAAARHRSSSRRASRPGRARLHPVPLGGHPSGSVVRRVHAARRRGHRASAAAARRAQRRTTSSSPSPAPSSTGCCPATSRPGCSPRCSTPPRPSTPPASGP